MDLATECELGHRNLHEFSREDCRWQDPHEVVDADGLLCFAGASTFPAYCNGMFRTDDALDGTEALARATAFFHERGRGFSVWTRETDADRDLGAAVAAAGHGKVFDYPQMICREPFAEAPLPDATYRWVETADDVRAYAAVNGEAYTTYGAPDDVTRSHFGVPTRVLAPHVHSLVAWVDDQPLAAAQVVLSHGIAGVYWVGTVEAARGRGLAEACVRLVTNRALDLGAANVQLQASVMGEPIYRRMGYEELYRYSLWLARGPDGA